MQWEGKFGPSAILAIAQLAVLMAGGIYTYAKLENTAANTAATTTTLREIVGKQRERTDTMNDRLIKVETVVSSVASAVDRLDLKLDKITNNTNKP